MKLHILVFGTLKALSSLVNCMDAPVHHVCHPSQQEAQSLLFEGARTGSLVMVSAAIGHGADVNARNLRNGTALHFAANNGNIEVLRELLRRGAHVDAQDHNLLTPLIVAAYRGHQPVVQELLDHDANFNKIDNQNRTALYAAAYNGHQPVVHQLMEAGADEGISDFDQVSPLHAAAYFGHNEVVQELLSQGVDCDCTTIHQKTPLIFALQRGYKQTARLLVKFGAQLPPEDSELYDTLRNFFAHQPLNLAAAYGDMEVADNLLKGKKSHDIQEAILYAVGQRRMNLVHLLLGHGANPEIALHHAELILNRTTLTYNQRVAYGSIQEQAANRRSLREQTIRQGSLFNPELIHFECLPLEVREPLAQAALLASLRSGNIRGVERALPHISLAEITNQITEPHTHRRNFSLYALLAAYCINLMS
jgi:ankyrin repeat protein